MKIYYSNLGSADFTPEELPPVGVLDSYAAIKKPKTYAWADSLFLDSGAFTAWGSGKPIDLQRYISWVKEFGSVYDVVASLDVIGDHAASWQNHLAMRAAGLHPMPAYHMGEPIAALDQIVASGETYIGLGGVVGVKARELGKWLRSVFQRYPDPSQVGFHGYGINDETVLTSFPWKSVDAATVHRAARLGGCWTPFGVKYICEFTKTVKDSRIVQSPEARKIMREWVESLGYSWDLATQRTNDGIRERCKVSIRHFESVAKKVPTRYVAKQPTFLF